MPSLPRAARRRRPAVDLERPVNTRLYRISLGAALLLTLAASFAVTRPEVLPAPPPPAFDRTSATTLASTLAGRYPDRAPGSPKAAGAADWVQRTLESYGYTVRRDRFRATIPGRGRVTLQNLVAIARGRTGRAIVIDAHRDDTGAGPGADVNASGTAALLELARLYGNAPTTAGGGALRPTHTLIFLSSDGGAFGSLGAAHYAALPGVRERTLAAINLTAASGHARPRIDIGGVGARSPAPALVATANTRIRDLTGRAPRRTGIAGQLIDLAFPLSLYDHAPFLARGIPALTLTTANVRPPDPFGDGPERMSSFRLGQIGSAAQSLIDSLDQGRELDSTPSSYILLGSRIVAGWAVEGALIALVVPVALVTLDLFSRRRRLLLPLWGAARGQGRRLGFWFFAALAFWVFAAAGLWIEGAKRPLSPFTEAAGDWPVVAVGAYLLLVGAGWAVARLRLTGARPSAAEQVAGYAVALVLVLATAALTVVTNPYALIFILPSLHAWLWLLQLRGTSRWLRALLYALGFIGPLVLLGSIAIRFGLGLDAPWYLAGLVAVGYVPAAAVLGAVAWLAAAGQVGALAFGRYAPYPNRGVRRRVGVLALARRLHMPRA
ncbi:MAG: M28 family peptidase [Gaiellaceae bacterium]